MKWLNFASKNKNRGFIEDVQTTENKYREIELLMKTLYISKRDELYVQCGKETNVNLYEKVTFVLGTSIRVRGTVSRITTRGFYVFSWTIEN